MMTGKIESVLLKIGSVCLAAVIVWLAWSHSSDKAKRTYQFGPVPLNAKLTHDLVIRNPQSTVLQLHSVKPSCTCLRIAEPIPKQITANGQITLQLAFVPEKLGPQRISVQLDCPGLDALEWFFTAEVIPPPEALPSPQVVNAARQRLLDKILLPAAECVTLPAELRQVIDVRSSVDFQNSTPIGAIHVPLTQLHTLPASLRKRSTLILDRGFGADSTVQTVVALRNAGWKDLHIIEGGLSAWSSHGGRITSAESPLAWFLSSEEARIHATRPGWMILVPESLAQSWRLHEFFPDLLTYKDTEPAVAAALAAKINSRRPGDGATTSVLHILVATEGGENVIPFAQALRAKLTGCPVFILGEGLRNYLEQLRNLSPIQPRDWTTMTQFAGALADLRVRQRLVTSCSSCSR